MAANAGRVRIEVDVSAAKKELDELLGVLKSFGGAVGLAFNKSALASYAMEAMDAAAQAQNAGQATAGFSEKIAQLSSGMDQIKSSIGQGLISIADAALPGINTAIEALATLAQVFAKVSGLLFGKSAGYTEQAAVQTEIADSASAAAEETDALALSTANAGKAAKSTSKAFKSVLAGFDELNVLNFGRGGSSGGSGGGKSGVTLPEVENGGTLFEDVKVSDGFLDLIASLSPLETILAALGATLATAGIAAKFFAIGGAVKSLISLLKAGNLRGALAGIGGALEAFAKKSGKSSGFIGKLGAALSSLGEGNITLSQAINEEFGSWATTVAGIATVVGGAVLAVTNFLAMLKDGFSWVREALMALGIAIAAVGAVILGAPAAVAAVVAAIVAAVATVAVLITEHWESVKAVFLGAWETVTAAWSGLAEWFSVNVIAPLAEYFTAVGQTISDVFQGCWILVQAIWQAASDWFRQNVAERFVQTLSPLVERAREIFQAIGEIVAQFCSSAGEWFNLHFAVPAKRAFQAVSDFVRSIFNGLIGMVEGMLNGIISRINFFLAGFSMAVRQAAEFLGVSWGGVSPLPTVSLPRLAQGAVIPPNRQFAAILGDQRSGTNIEAPLATIEQALQNVLNRNGGAGKEINVTVESVLDGRVIARNTVRHINDMTQAAGRPVLVL